MAIVIKNEVKLDEIKRVPTWYGYRFYMAGKLVSYNISTIKSLGKLELKFDLQWRVS